MIKEDSTKYNENSSEHLKKMRSSTHQSPSAKLRDKFPSLSGDDAETTEITAQISAQEEGGWGWVVVTAAFFNLFILDGVSYTFGSILPDMVKELQMSETAIAFVNSLSVALYFLVSPLASALINRFGFRECSMIGAIVCSISLVISHYATNYAYLCLFYGVFAGFGYSLINMASGLVVGFYFEKLRSLAMAVTTCGSSFGVMTMFPVNLYLVNLAGWRSTILLHSGLMGLIFFFAMAFRPLLSFTVSKSNAEPCNMGFNAIILQDTTAERIFGTAPNSNYPTVADVVEKGQADEAGPSTKSSLSKIKLTSVTKIRLDSINPPGGISERHLKQVQSLMTPTQQHRRTLEINIGQPLVKKQGCWARFCYWEPHLPYSRPLYRDDVFYGGDIQKLNAYRKSIASPETTGFDYQLAVTRTVTVKDLKDNRGLITTGAKRVLATMLDPSLLRRPSCLMICSSGFMTYTGYLVPYVFLPERNLNAGIDPKHCALFISTMSFSNIIGKLVLGALAGKIDPMKLFIFWGTMSGVCTLGSDLSFSIYYQYLYCFIFGFSTSSFMCLRGVILVSLYGLEKLTNATGVILIFLGLGNLISTPIASILKNNYGYNVAFWFAGIFMALSGLIMIPVKAASVRESREINDDIMKSEH